MKENEYISFVSNKRLPDKEIEIFWYGWKAHLNNIFRPETKKNDKFMDKFNLVNLSNHLNSLQQKEQFTDIIYCIEKNLSLHLQICLENHIDLYYTNICYTFIKRWKKIKESSTLIYLINDNDCIKNFILFEIYYLILNSKTLLTDQDKLSIYDALFFSDINNIIDFAITYKKSNILDKLREHFDVLEYIENKYDIKFSNKTKSHKIIKKLLSIKN